MTKSELLNLLGIDDIMNIPNSISSIIFSDDIEKRNELYFKLLELNKYDVSYDWFQSIYEDDLAQRKTAKQDFTPNSVGVILSKLTSSKKGKIYEPTAGNGSLLISKWWQTCIESDYPLMHFPSEHMIECWELSSRSIPILLLNLQFLRGKSIKLLNLLTCRYSIK